MTRPLETVRYPLGPLEKAVGFRSGIALAEALDISTRQLYRARMQGLSSRQADHYAVRLGLHPVSVWADFCNPIPTKETAACCRALRLADGRPVIGWCGPLCERRLAREAG